jgi:hypothetical protein
MLSATVSVGSRQTHSIERGGKTAAPAITVQPIVDATPMESAIRITTATQLIAQIAETVMSVMFTSVRLGTGVVRPQLHTRPRPGFVMQSIL